MDVFVKEQLKLCNCEHVTDLFAENEIDETAFRKLTMADLREILQGKVGIQKKILEAIQNLGRQPEDFRNANNSVFTADVKLLPARSIPSGHNAATNGTEKNGRPVHDDLMNMSHIQSLLQEYTFHDALEQTAHRERVTKNHEISKTCARASSPQNGRGPSEPPRVLISPRILKRKEKLPIFSMQQDFVEEIRNNQVLIVVGETGSGKSTQLTQYLYENGFGTCGKIGCTQPRRVAAKALAKRVTEEVGSELGDKVGYRIRFDNKTAGNTSIIYMTDGILLQELAQEPLIYSYACIMLDEAHERSMNTDVLLGLLKMTIRKRPDLKLLITSATIDATKFSKYFDDAPIFEIPGRTFPVDMEYVGYPGDDYVNACANAVMRIHQFEKEGDILVFLGGEGEIERCCDLIFARDEKRELWILPCYSSLPFEEQNKVFEPAPDGYKRKVVVATNIAETSITIDGIVYVVDSGIVKQSEYDPQKKLTTLDIMQITKAQAIQRAGRAGRTRPGKCFRLYTEYIFNTMPKAPVPEIVRSNLESTVLMLAAHGVEDISSFEFMDPPPRQTIEASVAELKDLEALDSNGRLTPLGRQISRFPLEPKLSKALIMSVDLKCTDEILTLTSIFSVQNSGRIFLRPKKERNLADSRKAAFFKPEGDHHTYLNVFTQWQRQNYSWEWCHQNYINLRALEEVLAIREQLEYVLELTNLKVTPSFSLPDPQAIQKCIASGYFSRIAHKTARGHGYVTYANPDEKEQVFIHPSSALFKSKPSWIIYEELKNTGNKAFLINVVAVDPRWIREYAPQFFQKLKRVFPQLMYCF